MNIKINDLVLPSPEVTNLKSKWFINLLNTYMPEEIIDVVSLGNKFSYNTDIKKSDVIKNFEYAINFNEFLKNDKYSK